MRAQEQRRFIEQYPTRYPVSYVEAPYETELFYKMAEGMEEPVALPVTRCGYAKARNMQQIMDLISLRRLCRSAR